MSALKKIGQAGDKGTGVRSDCFVSLELTPGKDRDIQVQSKVAAMYGKTIKNLAEKVLDYYELNEVKCIIEDTGALDFVMAARIEAAVKQIIDTDKEFLPEMNEDNKTVTSKERFRFSRLYLPGNTPRLFVNAGLHSPDGMILDLEDSVSPVKKDDARIVVRNTLRALKFYGAERMVRINQLPMGMKDLEMLVPHYPNMFLIPKCEDAETIHVVEKKISEIHAEYGIKDYPIYLMPIIESAIGVINAYSIATASENVVALAIGLEDYTADLGCKRTDEGTESFYARSVLVNACRAAGIQPIDSVFSDVSDMDALRENVRKSKALGFDGMGCIHPRQISVIHETYAPDEQEIDKAKKIVLAFDEAESKGLGVVSLGNKMIDPPVVKRAMKSIDVAIKVGKLNPNWKEESNDE